MMEFIVLGASWCPVCTQARDLLAARQLITKYYDLDLPEVPPELSKLKEDAFVFRRAQTLPQIYQVTEGDPVYVGGYVELAKCLTQH